MFVDANKPISSAGILWSDLFRRRFFIIFPLRIWLMTGVCIYLVYIGKHWHFSFELQAGRRVSVVSECTRFNIIKR